MLRGNLSNRVIQYRVHFVVAQGFGNRDVRCSKQECKPPAMVHYRKNYGKCHVCSECSPRAWFRCVLCGNWMGMSCDPKRKFGTSYSIRDDRRFDSDDAVLHCYIWTSDERTRAQRADLCSNCATRRIWQHVPLGENLPTSTKRRIWQFVSWGSWW